MFLPDFPALTVTGLLSESIATILMCIQLFMGILKLFYHNELWQQQSQYSETPQQTRFKDFI